MLNVAYLRISPFGDVGNPRNSENSGKVGATENSRNSGNSENSASFRHSGNSGLNGFHSCSFF